MSLGHLTRYRLAYMVTEDEQKAAWTLSERVESALSAAFVEWGSVDALSAQRKARGWRASHREPNEWTHQRDHPYVQQTTIYTFFIILV